MIAADDSLDLVHIVGGAVYQTVDMFTEAVGLNPIQGAELVGAIVAVCVLVSLVLTLSGRRGWTLDE